LKISFIPRYGRGAASSRLRVYAIGDAMNRHAIATAIEGYDDQADVLVVQKAVMPEVFSIAAKFRGRVIYDVDDVIDQGVFMCACAIADTITVDTHGRAADLENRLPRNYKAKRVAVIPDALDYEGDGPYPVATPDDRESVVWFGNYPNFESAKWMISSIASAEITVGAISDISRERAAAWGLPCMSLIAWNPETFATEFRKWGVCALSHRGADPFKSVNKMAAAYHLGVPCIVSGSDAYRQLAKESGLEWTYVTDIAALFSAWERLQDPIERKAAVERVQPIVWERYRAEAVARKALEVYASA